MNLSKFNLVFSVLNLVISISIPLNAEAQSKTTFGWVEKAMIHPGDIILHAKLDSGADNSSLDASSIEEFARDGQKWVRFELTNRYGEHVKIEKEIRRIAIIKRHHGKHQRRKVVRMGVCLGNVYLETDVTIVDRSSFDYQMLLGRTFMAGNVLLDPAVTYTAEPKCTFPNTLTTINKSE